jgi:hypothetical protein
LVDYLGSLEDAIDLTAKRVGMKESPTVYYSRQEQEPWWEKILFSILGTRWPPREKLGLRYEWSPSLLR